MGEEGEGRDLPLDEADRAAMAETDAGAPVGKPKRPNRFDRPKPPHDWRWAVAGVGRVLIATGVLMFGFVAYQLWGTAIQTRAAQNRLENEFEQLMESMTTLPFPGDAASTGTTASGTPTTGLDGPVGPDGSTPIGTASDTTIPGATVSTDGSAPTAPSATTLPPGPVNPAVTAPPAPLPTPAPLELIGRLDIPSIGASDYIVQGVSRRALKEGPGHFPETPLPGQLGNTAIAGHRTTYGAPFGDIDEVQVGDEIIAEMPGAGTYVYVTVDVQIVDPGDYLKIIPTLDPLKATMTLVSCHPEYSTRQRLVVIAELDPSRSNIVTQPSEPAASDSGGELPSEDVPETPVPTPATTADTTADTTPAAPPETTPAPAPTDTAPAPAGFASGAGAKRVVLPATTPSEQDDDSAEEGEDAFSAGWFDDEGAWWHVAGWGLLLTAISLGAYWISRKTKRNWVGALVGIIPFLFVLYFFYENVNRLLPPAL